MRAPVAFVVTRHLLTHRDDSPADLGRHCHVERSSAARAIKRLREDGIETDAQRLAHLLDLRTTPHWSTFAFRLPNPDNWLDAMTSPHWLTGEAAASVEGMDLVPSRVESYVHADDMEDAMRCAKRAFAKVAAPRDANLILRVADPWMALDPDDPLVERGQRLYDYARSKNVQFAKELARLG